MNIKEWNFFEIYDTHVEVVFSVLDVVCWKRLLNSYYKYEKYESHMFMLPSFWKKNIVQVVSFVLIYSLLISYFELVNIYGK